MIHADHARIATSPPAEQVFCTSLPKTLCRLRRFEPGFTAEQMGASVKEAVDWAEQHPVEVRAIVQRATAFAQRFLNRDAVDCYLLQVVVGCIYGAACAATASQTPGAASCLHPARCRPRRLSVEASILPIYQVCCVWPLRADLISHHEARRTAIFAEHGCMLLDAGAAGHGGPRLGTCQPPSGREKPALERL